MIQIDLDVVEARVAKYEARWMEAKRELQKTIAYCNGYKSTPPEGYWQEERDTRIRYFTAQLFLDSLLQE